MPRNQISVAAAVLAAIVDDIQQAIEHNRRWGGEMRLFNAAQRAQERLTEILAGAGQRPRRRS